MSNTTSLEINPDIERMREAALHFYEHEKDLSSDDRKQLYIFFEQQCRRMLLGFSAGVAIGATTPFIIRRKGSLVHPFFPVFGAVLGGTIVPGLVNHKIYLMQVEEFRAKYGEHSPICETIKYTPDPINKAVFWSNYFKKSSSDPNFRMKDPKSVTGTQFFSIEDAPKVPPYGKPGYYKSDELPQTLNEQYLSGWDKVRAQQYAQPKESSTSVLVDQNESQLQQDTSSTNAEDDPFEQHGEDKQNAFTINVSDHLISAPGANGSSWERIRHEKK